MDYANLDNDLIYAFLYFWYKFIVIWVVVFLGWKLFEYFLNIIPRK